MLRTGAPGADWIGVNAQNPDEWLTTAAAEAREAVAGIYAAGENEVTQFAHQRTGNRVTGLDADSDAELEALHRAVIRARRARTDPHGPNRQAGS